MARVARLREFQRMEFNARFAEHRAHDFAPPLEFAMGSPRCDDEIRVLRRSQDCLVVVGTNGIFRRSQSGRIRRTKREDVRCHYRPISPCLRKPHTTTIGGIKLKRIGRRRIEHEEIHRGQRCIPHASEQVAMLAIIRECRSRVAPCS